MPRRLAAALITACAVMVSLMLLPSQGAHADVTIIGDGNTVQDGLHNVTLISTNNYTATRSNITVLNNGEVVLFGGVIEGSEDEVRAISAATPIYTIDGGQNTVSNLYADYRNILN